MLRLSRLLIPPLSVFSLAAPLPAQAPGPLCSAQQAKLIPLGQGQYYGSSVSLDDATVAIGAIGHSSNGSGAGSVYVHTRSGTIWTQQARLLASDGRPDDWLGFSVALSGDVVAAGAPQHDVAFGNEGSVYVYRRVGSVWTQEANLLRPGGLALRHHAAGHGGCCEPDQYRLSHITSSRLRARRPGAFR